MNMDDRTRFSAIIAGSAGAGILLGILLGLFEITLLGIFAGVVSAFILAYIIGGGTETSERASS